MLYTLTEEQRQACVLALAQLRARRPGWAPLITTIVTAFDGHVMYREFCKMTLKLSPEGEEAMTWLCRGVLLAAAEDGVDLSEAEVREAVTRREIDTDAQDRIYALMRAKAEEQGVTLTRALL